MPVFTDQMGKEVILGQTPRRIISLVPSQTELLYSLGLDGEVVGITKFCVHPEDWFHNKTRVGGTKQLNMKIIHELLPDLVIANKEENVKAQVEELSAHFPVWTSDVNNLEDAYEMIRQISLICGKKEAGEKLIDQIRSGFSRLQPQAHKLNAAYLIWQKPYMTIGRDTFIHSMMKEAGFRNVFEDKLRYPEITTEEIAERNCQVIFLSSEPFPFSQKHVDELQPLLPNVRLELVDGEMFSWYGSRLLYAPSYFSELQKKLQ